MRPRLALVALLAGCRAPVREGEDTPTGMSDDAGTGWGATWDWDTPEPVDTGDTDTETEPVDTAPFVSSRDDYVEIHVWGSVNCAIREDRTADCWGDGTFPVMPRIEQAIVDLDVGSSATLWTIEEGELWITFWGDEPSRVGWIDDLPADVAQFDIPWWSYWATLGPGCAVTQAGDLSCFYVGCEEGYCWEVPEWEGDATGFIDVAWTPTIDDYRGYTCGLRADQSVECQGEQGDFTPIPDGTRVRQLDHGWGLTVEGSVLVWDLRPEDADLPLEGPYVKFCGSPFYFDGCGLREDGTVRCATSSLAAQVPEDVAFLDFDGLSSPRCGVRLDGRVQCWVSDVDTHPERGHPP